MVNSLGLWRSQSNDLEYQQWRVENGYYEVYDYDTYVASSEGDQVYYNQVNEITRNHATWFAYNVDGNITLAGTFKTTGGNTVYEYADRYQYDADENLIAIIDANGYALQWSDDNYWRDMRKELGYFNELTGEGLYESELTDAQKIE